MADYKGEIPQPELPTVASSPVTSVRENDEDEVWWDGPDDPENPLNWTSAQRWVSIWMVSFMTFLTAFGTRLTLLFHARVVANHSKNSFVHVCAWCAADGGGVRQHQPVAA